MSEKIINYLGIDWGEKRIGLALGDSETRIATPYKIVSDINEIIKVTKEEDVDIIVLGKPFKMGSVKAPVMKEFNDFLDLLKKEISIPVEVIDERLSSKAADALVGDKKTKASRDAMAAMIILQTYLDKQLRA